MTGKVAELLAVEKDVVNAGVKFLKYSKGFLLVTKYKIAGNIKNPCMKRASITVQAYFPIFANSARNRSPPPAAPSFEAISANTPIGAKYMIK